VRFDDPPPRHGQGQGQQQQQPFFPVPTIPPAPTQAYTPVMTQVPPPPVGPPHGFLPQSGGGAGPSY
jgi:hypothetical protein